MVAIHRCVREHITEQQPYTTSDMPSTCTFRFIGDVVETSHDGGHCFAKISITQICIELPAEDCGMVHLGDTVAFETGIETQDCRRIPGIAVLAGGGTGLLTQR